ncbi:sortase [Motilimonas pumila]|uniref:sortase n=1 Tax=Motilimonas pumila TaxID=2303987 RepID=UPI00131432D3|nr:sortase [Motilimonas pumila]
MSKTLSNQQNGSLKVAKRCLWLTLLLMLMCGAQAAYMPIKGQLAQLLMMRSWQLATTQAASAAQSGNSGQPFKAEPPWPWADTRPSLLLTTAEASWLVMDQSHGEALAFGPGMMAGSFAPGSGGETVIAGHRDTHFKSLAQLQLGQQLTLTDVMGTRFYYRVSRIAIIDSSLYDLTVSPVQARLLLVTCFPFDQVTQGPLRYVVEADLISQHEKRGEG